MQAFQLGKLPPEFASGGKARGLDDLVREGFSVPRGFVLHFESREDFEGFRSRIEGAWRISEPEIAALIQGCAELGPELIVRSSAPLEDGETQSFAGIFLSLRCQNSMESLGPALLECLRAIDTDKALAYQSQELDGNFVVHLVVQEFVEARFSGVLFTGSDEACIELVWGGCEALVSGERTPFTLQAVGDRLLLLNPGHDPSGEIRSNWLRIFTKVRELVEKAKTLTSDGRSLDIEWLVDREDRMWFLQKRPVTRPLPARAKERRKPAAAPFGVRAAELTNVNLIENYPRPVLPLVLSIAKTSYRHYFAHLGRAVGVKVTPEMEPVLSGVVCGVDGYLFYNLSAIEGLIDRAPLSESLKAWFHQFIGHTAKSRAGGARASLGPRASLAIARFCARAAVSIALSRRRVHAFAADIDSFLADADTHVLSLMDQLRFFLDRRFNKWAPLAVSDLSAMLSFGALSSFLARFAPKFHGEGRLSFLLLAIDDLISTRNSIALGEVIDHIRAVNLSEEWLMEDDARILERMESKEPGWRNVGALFKTYQDEWGFRFSQELTLDEENYQDDPLRLVRLIKSLFSQGRGLDPRGKLAGLEDTYRRAHDEALAELRASRPLSRRVLAPVFRFLVDWARESIRYREIARTQQARLYARLRRTALEIGDRFVDQGLCWHREDVLFLSFEEVLAIADRQFPYPETLIDIVQLRREAHRRALALPAPPAKDRFEARQVIRSSRAGHAPIQGDADDAGLVACAGSVSGRAAVITSLADIGLVKEGDVLVTPQTDPGWSPVFPLLRGLVVENGGLLSHGAILAREFGVPCIVGLPGITSRVKTGDWIELDGATGRVCVSDEPGASEPVVTSSSPASSLPRKTRWEFSR